MAQKRLKINLTLVNKGNLLYSLIKQLLGGIMEKLKSLAKQWKILLLLVVGVILLSAIFYMGWNKFQEQRPIATVGDKEIKMADFKSRLWEVSQEGTIDNPAQKLSEAERKSVLNSMIEAEIILQESQKLGYRVDESLILKKAKESVEFYELLPSFQKQKALHNAKVALLQQEIIKNKIGWVEGTLLMARFDQEINDKEITAQKKEYAEKLIKDLCQQITDKKITIEQAVQIIRNDEEIGDNSFLPYSVSMGFKFDRYLWDENYLLTREDLRRSVVGVSEKSISSPIVYNDRPGGSRFMVVWVDFTSLDGDKYPSYEEWLSQKKQEYGVKLSSNADKQILLSNAYNLFRQLSNTQNTIAANQELKCDGLVQNSIYHPVGVSLQFVTEDTLGGADRVLTEARSEVKFDPKGTRAYYARVRGQSSTIDSCPHEDCKSFRYTCVNYGVYDADSKLFCGMTKEDKEVNCWKRRGTTGLNAANSSGFVTYGQKDACGAQYPYGFACLCSTNAVGHNNPSEGSVYKGSYYIINLEYTGSGTGNWSLESGLTKGGDELNKPPVLVPDANNTKKAELRVWMQNNGGTLYFKLKWKSDVKDYKYDIEAIDTFGYPVNFDYIASRLNDSNFTCVAGEFPISPAGTMKIAKGTKYSGRSTKICNVTFMASTSTTLDSGWELTNIKVLYPNGTTHNWDANKRRTVTFNETVMKKSDGTIGTAIISYVFKHTPQLIVTGPPGLVFTCAIDTINPSTGPIPFQVVVRCDSMKIIYSNLEKMSLSGQIGMYDNDYRVNCTGASCATLGTCKVRDYWQYAQNSYYGSFLEYLPKIESLSLIIDWGNSESTNVDLASQLGVKDKAWGDYYENQLKNLRFSKTYETPGDYKIEVRATVKSTWNRTSQREVIEACACGSCPAISSVTESWEFSSENALCSYTPLTVRVTGRDNQSGWEVAP
jgi:hypothetical protein